MSSSGSGGLALGVYLQLLNGDLGGGSLQLSVYISHIYSVVESHRLVSSPRSFSTAVM